MSENISNESHGPLHGTQPGTGGSDGQYGDNVSIEDLGVDLSGLDEPGEQVGSKAHKSQDKV